MYLFNSCKMNVGPVTHLKYQSKKYFYKGIADSEGNNFMHIIVYQEILIANNDN